MTDSPAPERLAKPGLSPQAARRRRITGLSVDRIAQMEIQLTVATNMVAELRRVLQAAEARNMAVLPGRIVKWIDDCMTTGDEHGPAERP